MYSSKENLITSDVLFFIIKTSLNLSLLSIVTENTLTQKLHEIKYISLIIPLGKISLLLTIHLMINPKLDFAETFKYYQRCDD